jgi:diguanylate cyclase (GGDEF)-like protein
LKVLVAEDDATVRALILRAVEGLGWQAVAAHDGLEALAELGADHALSLAVLDWMMPGADGIEIARHVRASARARYLYIILLTGRSARADVLTALRAGVDDLLAKPFDHELLVARLEAGRRLVDAEARKRGRLSRLDEVTGLPARDAIVDRLALEAERCGRAGEPLSVALVDIDRLRSLNESGGRPAGDAALRAVAGRLRVALREADCVGRYGGDEFLVTLPACDEQGAARCAERLQRRVTAPPSAFGPLRVSIGCATSRGSCDLELLIQAADLALRRAKLDGACGWAVASRHEWAASHP